MKFHAWVIATMGAVFAICAVLGAALPYPAAALLLGSEFAAAILCLWHVAGEARRWRDGCGVLLDQRRDLVTGRTVAQAEAQSLRAKLEKAGREHETAQAELVASQINQRQLEENGAAARRKVEQLELRLKAAYDRYYTLVSQVADIAESLPQRITTNMEGKV
jgi:hypothetical protein